MKTMYKTSLALGILLNGWMCMGKSFFSSGSFEIGCSASDVVLFFYLRTSQWTDISNIIRNNAIMAEWSTAIKVMWSCGCSVRLISNIRWHVDCKYIKKKTHISVIVLPFLASYSAFTYMLTIWSTVSMALAVIISGVLSWPIMVLLQQPSTDYTQIHQVHLCSDPAKPIPI